VKSYIAGVDVVKICENFIVIPLILVMLIGFDVDVSVGCVVVVDIVFFSLVFSGSCSTESNDSALSVFLLLLLRYLSLASACFVSLITSFFNSTSCSIYSIVSVCFNLFLYFFNVFHSFSLC
jgi:hypothetical protein